ncbi:MAG TPA: hypothetical protein VHP32_10470 [Ignavibacteria bacterium]|nr:hypothetical protein [Ignavibacteria bacterium]
MKKAYIIPLIFIIFSCGLVSWIRAFHDQEVYRIIIIKKEYNFFDGEYFLKDSSATFETYNNKNQKIGLNNREFYVYDSVGRMIEKHVCMDWCDRPYTYKYFYNSNGKLEKIITFPYNNLVEHNIYDEKNRLIEKRKGEDPYLDVEYYTYKGDSMNVIRTNRSESYIVDSLYYDINNRLIRKERRKSDETEVHIREMQYNDFGLLSMTIDTTINSDTPFIHSEGLLITSYYNKIEYKYNNERKLIEEIQYKPDYKTPCCKYTYEYIYKYK